MFLVNLTNCRPHRYTPSRAGFIFVRVRTSPAIRRKRLRNDHTAVDESHAVEKGFEELKAEHEIENDSDFDATKNRVDQLLSDALGRQERLADRKSDCSRV